MGQAIYGIKDTKESNREKKKQILPLSRARRVPQAGEDREGEKDAMQQQAVQKVVRCKAGRATWQRSQGGTGLWGRKGGGRKGRRSRGGSCCLLPTVVHQSKHGQEPGLATLR